MSGAECEEMKKYGEMGSVKRERGSSVKKRENVTRRESENLSYSFCVKLISTGANIQLL
jgi:hypothetical protein